MRRPEVAIDQFDRAYFIGVGGIGMSALARYFNALGWTVAGYDKTRTKLTDQLADEGIDIHYEDWGPAIPTQFQQRDKTLFIYTPAIPRNFGELLHVQHNNFHLHKRAEVLGMITRNSKALGVAGTHGKTTTSTMLAHILQTTDLKCNAFLGGISSNFNSNFVSNPTSEFTVIEADEFDRSFLQLSPFASIITSTDADHLDIYGDNKEFLDGFNQYAQLIAQDGFLVRHSDVAIDIKNTLTYAIDKEADFKGFNLCFQDGYFQFNLQFEDSIWENVQLGIPGIHNAENAIACIAMCINLGLNESEIRHGLRTFKGVKRRFEYHIKTENLVYVDDYAHHPTEISALIRSIKLLYPTKAITGIFQPHLFTRTRDFFEEFANQLSALDRVILLPIYPAREEPISGITSEALLEQIQCSNKEVMTPDEVLEQLSDTNNGVVLTIGAGDIDRIVEPLKKLLTRE